MKNLRQEMLAKEEELNRLYDELKNQQEECRNVREQLEKEKDASQELVSDRRTFHVYSRFNLINCFSLWSK